MLLTERYDALMSHRLVYAANALSRFIAKESRMDGEKAKKMAKASIQDAGPGRSED